MKKRIVVFVFFILCSVWAILGLLSYRFSLPIPSKQNPKFVKNHARELLGTIHFHTIHSDGSGTLQDIVEAAKSSGLDFMIVTDHGEENRFKFKEGHYDGVYLFTGAEIGSEQGHHLEIGNLKIMAHPTHPIVPWRDLDHFEQFDGVEIINESTMGHQAVLNLFPLLWSLIFLPFNPDYGFFSIYKNPDQELRLWDQYTQSKKMFGIAVTDAHANIAIWEKANLRIKQPSYRYLFRTLKMHFPWELDKKSLTWQQTKELVLEKLKKGNFYFSLDLLLDGGGFSFRLNDKKEIEIELGEKIPELPYQIRLMRNGVPYEESLAPYLKVPILEPGVYRAEVYLTIKNIFGGNREILWIASNPIYVEK